MTILLSVLISVVGTKALAHGIEKNADDVINFADTNVKAICLNYWDTNGDGELSMAEAAAVTNLGMVFYDKSITEFNELQYFTGLTSIYREAFSRCVDLISITIPNNVTTIDKYAFQGCSSLNALTIPNSVTTIDSYAFSGCSSLKSLTMQNGVTSIGDNAFNYCSSLESITIPNSVTSIGSGAFQGCSSLASITIPNSVTFIGSGAFNGTPWYNTWYNNQPDGLIYIGKIAYKYKGKMPANSSINILNGTLSIGVGAFSGCSGLVSVSIPNSVTDIGAAAFSGCSGLVSVSIPNSVTNIGINAFQYCSALTSITIPKSVTNIDCTACRGCYALISMIVEDGNTTYDSRDNCNAIIETSSNTLIAGCKSTVIPSTVTAIGQHAFDDCANLTTITIPDNVTSIGKYAFNNCNGLTSISIPHNVTSIGFYAFSDCNNLASITIPATVTSIGDYAFNPCPKLKSVTVKNPTPVAIETTTFDNQYNAKLYVPAGSVEAYQSANYWKDFTVVANIAYAVYSNGTLTFKYGEFTPNGTTSWDVSDTPFNGFLPSSLTWEGGLKHVVFDASFAEARPKSCSYWFDASKELESIEGLEYLNTSEVTTMNCMFEFCPKLTSLNLTHFDTSNVTDMGNMFAGTTGLTTLDLSSFNTSKVTIMTNMFAGSASETYGGSNKVETIYVGDGWTTDGITSAANGARMFDYCPNLKGGNGTPFNADHTDYTYARIDAAGTPGYLTKKSDVTTTTWTVTSTDNIPAGTKYELDDITLTIGEAGSNDFTVNEWGEPYDETFINLICGNGVNGNKEGGTFYLFKPKKNGNLTVYVSQNPVKKLYVEESGRVMDAFNGISHEEITEGQYKGTYTIPVYTNLTYKLYCAGSKLSFYGFTFEGRNDAEVANITFADEKVKALCVDNWDTNQDGELSFAEAAAVTDIRGVFKDNKEISSFNELRFFTGLTSLSFGALNECFELKSVCIPSGIVEMDGGAFASCHKLEYIGVDASNPKFKSYGTNNAVIERAANRLVVGCPNASIPDNITTIGKAAFWGHAGEWKDIPASVTKIDEGAFAYGGLNAVNISANVEYIGESAFRCNGLWEVVIPAKVTYIGKDAFNECDRLGKVTVLNPNPIELINAETFNNRANATLSVPVGSKTAYEAAPIWKEFKRIVETGWAVTSTDEIPAGTVIELDDITMTIGEAGSPNFTVDTWDSYDEPFTKRIVGNGVNGDREGGTFYLFKPKKNGTLKVIVRQSVKNPKKFYVEESGRVMDAFNGILPETTDDVYIGPYTIPVFANLTYKIYCAGSKMGFYGFTFEGRDDAEWTNIEFADEKVKALCVTNWDTDHNGELSMTEAAAVTTLGDVFKENREITSFNELRFFTGLTELTGECFYTCDKMKSITIPSGVSAIDGFAFANCSDLEQISVDPGNIVFNASLQCNAIIETATNKLVVGCQASSIPEKITIIGNAAFWGRWSMPQMDIPESVKTIENDAFAYCPNLQNITLPEGLTAIGEGAFNECTNLTEVKAQNPVPVVLTNAKTFSNRANAKLFVPNESVTTYQNANIWQDFSEIAGLYTNHIYSDDVTAYLGCPTEMAICLENEETYTAFQFDLVLPEGITLEKNTKGNVIYTKGNRYSGMRTITITPHEGNMYRIVSTSIKNNEITGNSGALLTVSLLADESLEKKTYTATIENVILTKPDGSQLEARSSTISITTKEVLYGDSNDDGNVNVTDAVVSINNILGRPSVTFNKTQADINRDRIVDIYDVFLGLNIIRNNVRMMSRAGESSDDKLSIGDFTITPGETKQFEVELTNEASYAGFQFDLVLPEGISMTGYSVNQTRIPEEIEVDMEQADGCYRFIAAGFGTDEISGTSGSIMKITVKADENLKGRNLTGYLRDVKLSKIDGTGTTIDETAFKITNPTSGDLSGNGSLGPEDVSALVDLIMSDTYEAKADLNGDDKVNAVDLVLLTNLVNQK